VAYRNIDVTVDGALGVGYQWGSCLPCRPHKDARVEFEHVLELTDPILYLVSLEEVVRGCLGQEHGPLEC
jgi:hypothetical protein